MALRYAGLVIEIQWSEIMQTTKFMLAGLEWSERYGCYSAVMAGWLPLEFSSSMVKTETGYKVKVFGKTLKNRGDSPETAAKLALKAAKELVERAHIALAEATQRAAK
jgi:hypothetical protein